MTGNAPEPTPKADEADEGLRELATALAAFGPEEWDAVDARLGSAAALEPSQSGLFMLLERLESNFPADKVTLDLAYTLIPVLVSGTQRHDQFLRIASPEVVKRVEALRYRHGALVERLWSAFGEAEDWWRTDIEFWQRISPSGPSYYRLRIVTVRKDGTRLVLETTPEGLLRYVRVMLREIQDAPGEVAASIDKQIWADYADELSQVADKLRPRLESGPK
jgi:hypothetical protein